MDCIDIKDAKTHLSQLVQAAADGKAFVITKSGKPMVKDIPANDAGNDRLAKLGFLSSHGVVPVDFNDMGSEKLANLFCK